MTPQFHVYPYAEENPSIGHRIIELIADGLITVEDGICVWSGSAPEQLEALVESYYEQKSQ